MLKQPRLMWILAALIAPLIISCESTDVAETPFTRGTASDAQASDALSTGDAEAELPVLDGYCKLAPILERNRVCTSLLIPQDIWTRPDKVTVHFFPTSSPIGEPSVRGKELLNPDQLSPFVAGAEVPMILENIPSEGQGYLIATIFMPGGGMNSGTPVANIDYVGVGNQGEVLRLSGEPINLNSPIFLEPAP